MVSDNVSVPLVSIFIINFIRIMKKTITIICDIETTVPHLLNQEAFDVIPTSKEDIWTMVKKEKEDNTLSSN